MSDRSSAFLSARCDECVYSSMRKLRGTPRRGRVGFVRECHRNAPLPDSAPWGGSAGGAWPVVQDGDWCGEFRARDPR